MSKRVTLHFAKSGMYTLIQDAGRIGHQHEGIPYGGYLDRTSARIANFCAWNPADTPLLEITMTGPLIRFEGDCQIAIAGADMSPVINGTEVNRYETIDVVDQSELAFEALRSGCHTYLAVHGAWQLDSWLDSVSPLMLGQISHMPSSIITKGSTLVINVPDRPAGKKIYDEAQVTWPAHAVVHVLPGPEFKALPAAAIAFFFNTVFTISNESNRMGYRLQPMIPEYAQAKELISSAMIPGTIQLSREGQPVLLLADAQTTGGYPRIAHVVQDDIDALAQLRPGNTVQFQIVKKSE